MAFIDAANYYNNNFIVYEHGYVHEHEHEHHKSFCPSRGLKEFQPIHLYSDQECDGQLPPQAQPESSAAICRGTG